MNARILAQPEIHLTVTGIDGDHTSGAMLQQTIRESTRGSADIETYLALDIDFPVFQSAFKFESAAADIFQVFAQQPNCGIRGDLRARLIELLVIDQDFPGENESLGAFSGGSQPTIKHEFVESEFQSWHKNRLWERHTAAERCTTKVPALAAVQNAEPFPAEPLTKILRCFSTEFSTVVLKTFWAYRINKKAARKGRP